MNGTRHEWIDELCARLERILLGRLADDLLQGDLPEAGALVVTPVWRWLPPRIDMGRKTRRGDGATMLMPVRMSWQPSAVAVITAPTAAAWSMVGLGHSGAGTVNVEPVPHRVPVVTGDVFPTAGTLQVQTVPRRALAAQLEDLAADGRQARWDALMSLEHYVNRAVHSAVVSVSWDVNGTAHDQEPAWVLDETAKQAVADRMLLGTEESPGRVGALLERCLQPNAFVKVDPLRYVVKDLHRSAEAEVRKTIGDPHIGRKIRAVRRTMPSAPMQDVIAAYRAAHPGDHLSTARAARALTAGPDVMAGFTEIGEAEALISSHEDQVVSRLDAERVKIP